MSDVVVTVPKSFQWQGLTGLAAWIAEGDAAGEPWSGQEWDFYLGGHLPKQLETGDRVYVVCNEKLRGYAPLVRVDRHQDGYSLVRRGDAVAVTIDEPIKGFRGFRYRWWDRSIEKPFPDWKEGHKVHP